eukprot:Nk52_evm35s621 gene=Nk52_evmTU35s621
MPTSPPVARRASSVVKSLDWTRRSKVILESLDTGELAFLSQKGNLNFQRLVNNEKRKLSLCHVEYESQADKKLRLQREAEENSGANVFNKAINMRQKLKRGITYSFVPDELRMHAANQPFVVPHRHSFPKHKSTDVHAEGCGSGGTKVTHGERESMGNVGVAGMTQTTTHVIHEADENETERAQEGGEEGEGEEREESVDKVEKGGVIEKELPPDKPNYKLGFIPKITPEEEKEAQAKASGHETKADMVKKQKKSRKLLIKSVMSLLNLEKKHRAPQIGMGKVNRMSVHQEAANEQQFGFVSNYLIQKATERKMAAIKASRTPLQARMDSINEYFTQKRKGKLRRSKKMVATLQDMHTTAVRNRDKIKLLIENNPLPEEEVTGTPNDFFGKRGNLETPEHMPFMSDFPLPDADAQSSTTYSRNDVYSPDNTTITNVSTPCFDSIYGKLGFRNSPDLPIEKQPKPSQTSKHVNLMQPIHSEEKTDEGQLQGHEKASRVVTYKSFYTSRTSDKKREPGKQGGKEKKHMNGLHASQQDDDALSLLQALCNSDTEFTEDEVEREFTHSQYLSSNISRTRPSWEPLNSQSLTEYSSSIDSTDRRRKNLMQAVSRGLEHLKIQQ